MLQKIDKEQSYNSNEETFENSLYRKQTDPRHRVWAVTTSVRSSDNVSMGPGTYASVQYNEDQSEKK